MRILAISALLLVTIGMFFNLFTSRFCWAGIDFILAVILIYQLKNYSILK